MSIASATCEAYSSTPQFCDTSGLPMTGYDVWMIAAVAAVLIITGFAVRYITKAA